jgi:ectoine hydroxylase-related dioxygenase (phytanoyl-CoA dioxygenase family)
MLNNYAHVKEDTLREWVEQFHRDGYLFLPDFLTLDLVEQLKADLDRELESHDLTYTGEDDANATMRLRVRLFERSAANLSLFDMDPIAAFAELLIAPNCHVIHNNSFITRPGGGITTWHQDDASHYLVTHGEPPANVRLPVLFFTANYYLTDVTEREHGGTEVIPGSHLFGGTPPRIIEGTKYESMVVPCLGKAGSVVLFNNQVWHRGGPNRSDRVRYITQVTYGRRIISHMFYPFMNYQMPEHVYRDADDRRRRLLGFLDHGAYG